MSLFTELGTDYMRERFSGCMFFNKERQPCYINGADSWPRNGVKVVVANGELENVTRSEAIIHQDFFTDLSVFSTPLLGWRMSSDGTYMAYLSRNNKSYQRALAYKVVNRELSPATRYLIDTGSINGTYYAKQEVVTAMTMAPKYLQFRDGLEKMRNGDIFSFCISPNLAVIPEVRSKQSLYFNTTKVGLIGNDGSILCTIPQIKTLIKDSIK